MALTFQGCGPGTPEQMDEDEQREIRKSVKRNLEQARLDQDSLDLETDNIMRGDAHTCMEGRAVPQLVLGADKGKAKMHIGWTLDKKNKDDDMEIDFESDHDVLDSKRFWDPDEPGPSSGPSGASYLMYVTTPNGNDPVWATDVAFNRKGSRKQDMPDGSAWRVDGLHENDVWIGCATALGVVDAVIRIVLVLPFAFSLLHKSQKGW